MIVFVVEPNNHIVELSDVYKLILHEDGSLHIEYNAGSLKYKTCSFLALDDYSRVEIRKEFD